MIPGRKSDEIRCHQDANFKNPVPGTKNPGRVALISVSFTTEGIAQSTPECQHEQTTMKRRPVRSAMINVLMCAWPFGRGGPPALG
jgi:hypothetical protein